MKAMKVEILVLDFDDIGEDEVRSAIENSHYPNHCIAPQIQRIKSVDIDWNDDHPLNKAGTAAKAYQDLFADV